MGVRHVKADLSSILPTYERVDDCISGQDAIKAKRNTYLPIPDPTNKSPENKANYEQYLERALFLGMLQRTFIGLEGMIFMREPEIKLPGYLKYIGNNADGQGNSLLQVSRKLVQYVAPLGRAGVLVDYPRKDGETKVSDIVDGKVGPRILPYHPKNVINWRVHNNKLVLVVLKESVITSEDEFAPTYSDAYRVLRLEDGTYTQQVYIVDGDNEIPEEKITPKKGNGQPFNYIPFTFIGSVNNDPSVDPVPLEALANLSIAHYRNSADYEQSIFIIGQPTLWAGGLDQNWVDTVLKDEIRLGCRGFLPLPTNGEAGLIQAEPNTLAKEGMDAKEKQMIALGAKLLDSSNGSVEQTRKEVEIKHTAEHSQLTQIAINLGLGITKALQWCAEFTKDSTKDVLFKLSTDYTATKLSSDDQRALREDYISGMITFAEMRERLLEARIATERNHEKAKREIEQDQDFLNPDLEGDNNV